MSNGPGDPAATGAYAVPMIRDILDKSDLPEDFYHRVENFKARGSSGKLNIALDSMPEFPALPKGSSLYHSDMHFLDSLL